MDPDVLTEQDADPHGERGRCNVNPMRYDLLEMLEDDSDYAALVDRVRADRAARGLDPDTGAVMNKDVQGIGKERARPRLAHDCPDQPTTE